MRRRGSRERRSALPRLRSRARCLGSGPDDYFGPGGLSARQIFEKVQQLSGDGKGEIDLYDAFDIPHHVYMGVFEGLRQSADSSTTEGTRGESHGTPKQGFEGGYADLNKDLKVDIRISTRI